MCEAEAEVDREARIGEDVTYAQACGGAGGFLVDLCAIRVIEDVAAGVGSGDVGAADCVAREGVDIPAGAGVIEGMAEPQEQGEEDLVRLVGGKIVEAGLCAYFVAVWKWEADVQVCAESGGGSSFCEELGDFELGVEGSAKRCTNSNKE